MRTRLAPHAIGQRDAILLESARLHGMAAAARYDLLFRTAVKAIGDDPVLAGSVELPRLPGVRAYPLRLSRLRIAPEQRVRSPRHVVVYRIALDGAVEILALVHDRMLLSRAARRAVRDAAKG